jgi:hypothetical protein
MRDAQFREENKAGGLACRAAWQVLTWGLKSSARGCFAASTLLFHRQQLRSEHRATRMRFDGTLRPPAGQRKDRRKRRCPRLSFAARSPPGYFCHWLAFFWRIDSGAAAVSPYRFPKRHRRRQPVASSHNYPLSLLSLSSAVSHRSPSWTWMNGSLYGCTYTTKKRKKIEGMVPKNLGIIVRGVEKTTKII